jgi:hypothetical protein
MITSQQLQNLSLEDFLILRSQCTINQETEKIIGKVFEEQFLLKKGILCYNLSDISELYHIPILENIKKRFHVSSIYIQNKHIYIDWSLISKI